MRVVSSDLGPWPPGPAVVTRPPTILTFALDDPFRSRVGGDAHSSRSDAHLAWMLTSALHFLVAGARDVHSDAKFIDAIVSLGTAEYFLLFASRERAMGFIALRRIASPHGKYVTASLCLEAKGGHSNLPSDVQISPARAI